VLHFVYAALDIVGWSVDHGPLQSFPRPSPLTYMRVAELAMTHFLCSLPRATAGDTCQHLGKGHKMREMNQGLE